MTEDLVPQIGDDTLAEPGDEIEADARCDRKRSHDREHDREILVHNCRIAAGEAVIDDAADGDRYAERRGCGNDERDDGGCDMSAISGEQGQKPAEGLQAFALLLAGGGLAHGVKLGDRCRP